jgi:hypothetical protein
VENSVHRGNADEIFQNDADATIAQDAQAGLFCSSGLSGLTKQTRQTK